MNDTLTDTSPVTVLHGHTTPETAYVVGSYPYGSLRCQMRWWVETAEKGAKKGLSRVMTQTTNPKVNNEVFSNRPKGSTYSRMVFLYRDEKEHVHADHVSEYGIRPEDHVRRILRGIYGQLSESDLRVYDILIRMSQQYAKPWDEWRTALHIMVTGFEETGVMPARNATNHLGDGPGAPYLSDEAYEIAAAWVRHVSAIK